MKSFTQHLMESKKSYPFKVKIAGEITSEQEDTLKTLLGKYHIAEFKKTAKTPVQALPLDFPRLNNVEVNIWEVVLDYPVTSHELINYLGNGLRINEQTIVVRNPGEPYERYQEPGETREGALLTDPTYKESPNANPDDYYGDKYNASFVKALTDDLKAKREARGEVIPNGDDGKTLNEIPQDTNSPIGSRKVK